MICVECDSDETLVQKMGFKKENILHTFGKGNACNALRKKHGWGAMLDEDPLSPQHPYLRSLKQREEKYGLRLLQDMHSSNRVILLCPRLEEWIIQSAKLCGIDIASYNLPAEVHAFREALTNEKVRKEKFSKLLEALSETEQMQLLRRWLQEK